MPAEFPDPATPQKRTVFLVEAVQPQVPESEGDDNVDIVVAVEQESIRTKLERAIASLCAKGVKDIQVEVIGPSAIVHLRHKTFYHVGLTISALREIGDVTIHFPDADKGVA